MKYSCSVEVPLSREACIHLWLDESKFDEWQDGFQHKKWILGKPNETDSKSEIVWSQGKRKMELTETVLENELPDYILGEYFHIHMTNKQKISFEAISSQSTLIRSEVEYTEFRSFLPKIIATLFPGMFKKQSQKWLDQFRVLAENSKY